MTMGDAQAALMALIGTPWKEHSDTVDGMDCWGFVRYAFRLLEKELPFNTHEARRCVEAVEGVPEPFDIAYFRFGFLEKRHVGLVLNRSEMIHAADETFGVSTIRLARLRDVTLLRHRDFIST